MKIKSSHLLLLLVGLSSVISSCKKDEEETPEPTPSAATPSNPIPAPTGSDGALVAIETANYIDVPFVGEQNVPIGIGAAVFGNLSAPSYVNVGAVTINGSALSAQSNNTYVYTPAAANPNGLDFDSGISWTVGGGNGFGAFSVTNSKSMPTGPKYSGSSTISRAAEFSLSSSVTIFGADSVIYALHSPTGSVLRTVAGGVSSVTFSASEMSGLGAGSGYVQIAPYNIEAQVLGGKQIYLINESVTTKSVTFQ